MARKTEEWKPSTVQEAVGHLERQLERMYFTFEPRPDKVEEWDMQTSYYNSRHKGITFLLGGNGAGTTTLTLAKAVKFLLRDQPPPGGGLEGRKVCKGLRGQELLAQVHRLHEHES